MIRLEDRRNLALDIDQAHAAGARLECACEVAGIDVRTLQRWKADDGLDRGDRRPEAEPGWVVKYSPTYDQANGAEIQSHATPIRSIYSQI